MDITLPSGDLSELLEHPLVLGLLEASSDGAVIIDATSRQVLAMNARARELLGVGDDHVGSCCHETLNSPACQHACPLTRALQDQAQPGFTALYFRRHDDHQVVHADARMLVIRDGEGRPLAGIELLRDQRQVHALERQLRQRRTVLGLVGRSAPMQALYERIERLAPCDMPVLVAGPPGAGKRRVAEALHAASRRATGPLLTVALDHGPCELKASSLFDALDRAAGGSLVLADVDEVDCSLAQALAELVRTGTCTWEGRTRRAGDTRLVLTAARAPEPLAAAMAAATLRVPALSERLDDLPLLVEDLLARMAGPGHAEPEVLALLARRPWPGNVGQLARELAAAALRAGQRDSLRVEDFVLPPPEPALPTLADAEVDAIRRALSLHEGNLSAAARALGIDRSTLWRKLKRLEREVAGA